MDNKEVAAVFFRIADALEIKGENVFKIRAYRRAAQNLTDFSRQVEDVYKEDPSKLNDISGIGKDLKEKIVEMINTSHLKYYDDLMKEFPKGFLELLNIAGLGPKKLKKLKEELAIKNVNDLEKACKNGKLSRVEGMGEKTSQKLLEAIQYFRQKEGRFLLAEAEYFAGTVIKYLKKSVNFKKIEIAGSLRRGRETIGDVDILASAKNAGKAMDYFVRFPNIKNVAAKGLTKSSIVIKEGPQVDLRIIDETSFGAALVYFTGSKAHNIKIRKIAKDKNCKVNEYGVFSVSSSNRETKIAGKTEDEVYRKLGMEWCAPELREDQGEIEAALAGKLPRNLIRLKDIKGDLHSHTVETDGSLTIKEMVLAAKRKGYRYFAVTDHSKNVRIANGMDEKRLLKHIANIKKIRETISGIKVLAGVEVDILEDGKLDIEDYVLKELDVVIAAVHSKFSLDKAKQTNRILRAMDNKYVSILAHPSGRLITTRKPIQADFDKIFLKAAENNVCLEINTHGERIDLNDLHCRRAKEFGAKFVINTDAHDASQLDEIKYGVVTARRAWLEKKDVINTYTVDKLIKTLKR
ncbi:MAG: DNA polymerase/3'-5' exonuclease PolX [Candidatus Omnitrophota bacterium]